MHLDPGRFVKRQLTFLAGGAIVLMVAVSFDYRLLKVYAGIVYVSSLVLLVLVRTPLGTSVKGAQRWFELFGFQLAPSEVAKLALIAMLAAFLSELRGDLTLQDVFRTAALAAIPAFLVFLQPDLGSSIVFAAILVGMLVVAGARARYLGLLALAAIVLIVAGFQVGLVREYQIERLQAFLDPASVSEDALHNREQAEIAIGSGGLTGVGLHAGVADEPRLRPRAAHGLRLHGGGRGVRVRRGGGAAVVVRAPALARVPCGPALQDPFGTYLAAGIASMFALQMFVNVGMNDRHHADHGHPVAVRLVRRELPDLELRLGRAPAQRPHAPVRLSCVQLDRVTVHRKVDPAGPEDSIRTSPPIARAAVRASANPIPAP